jgi:hypothetical protein
MEGQEARSTTRRRATSFDSDPCCTFFCCHSVSIHDPLYTLSRCALLPTTSTTTSTTMHPGAEGAAVAGDEDGRALGQLRLQHLFVCMILVRDADQRPHIQYANPITPQTHKPGMPRRSGTGTSTRPAPRPAPSLPPVCAWKSGSLVFNQ